MVKWKKYLCVILSAAMLATCITGCGSTNEEEGTTQAETKADSQEEQKLEEALTSQLSFDDIGEADKEETVYVLSDASGNVESVLVSNWLKNTEGTDGIHDYTTLTDIENVKGYEQYVENEDGSITWQSNGSDIYYQGVSTEQLPVDVKVSYKLDGADIEPEELAGKSGKVTIRFDYTNNTTTKVKIGGTEKDVLTPFVMLSGVMLPVDKFSNVQVDNGKVISEGSNVIVVGYAVPGLKACLSDGVGDKDIAEAIDGIDIPEYVEITADVEDFSLAMTMTVGVTDLLSTENIDPDIDMTDLTKDIDTLGDSANQLADGSGELLNGLETLKEGTYSLKNGTNDLLTGANSLVTYTGQLADGTSKLETAVTSLTQGINSIKTGSYALKKGTATLSTGAAALKTGVDDVYSGEQTLKTGVDALVAGYAGDAESVGAVKGASDLKNGTKTLKDGAKSVSDGAKTVSDGVSTLVEAVSAIPATISGTASAIIAQTGLGSLENIAATMAQLETTATNGGLTGEQMAAYKQLSQAYYSAAAIMQISDTLTAQLGAMSEDMTNLQTGAKAVADGAKTVSDGAATVATGASSLSDGVSTLYSGTKAVSDGLKTLISGTKTLKQGAKDVADGAKTVSGSMKDLYEGSVTLANGGGDLLTATNTLNTSADSIRDGAKTLSDGVKTLNDGAKTLDDGADELKTGAGTLSEGMSKFNEEGIKKITEMFSGNYQLDIDYIEALFGQEAAYKNYSGALEGITTNVKFIYETGAIE